MIVTMEQWNSFHLAMRLKNATEKIEYPPPSCMSFFGLSCMRSSNFKIDFETSAHTWELHYKAKREFLGKKIRLLLVSHLPWDCHGLNVFEIYFHTVCKNLILSKKIALVMDGEIFFCFFFTFVKLFFFFVFSTVQISCFMYHFAIKFSKFFLYHFFYTNTSAAFKLGF